MMLRFIEAPTHIMFDFLRREVVGGWGRLASRFLHTLFRGNKLCVQQYNSTVLTRRYWLWGEQIEGSVCALLGFLGASAVR